MLHRIAFWIVAIITVATLPIVGGSLATGASVAHVLSVTTGGVTGIIIGQAPALFGSLRDGIGAGGGSGNGNSLFGINNRPRVQQPRPARQQPQQRTRPARPTAPGGGQLQAARRGQ